MTKSFEMFRPLIQNSFNCSQSTASVSSPFSSRVAVPCLQALGAPRGLAQIRSQNPGLPHIATDSLRVHRVWQNTQEHQRDTMRNRRETSLFNAGPLKRETQEMDEEIIREDRVVENLQYVFMNHKPGPIVLFSISPVNCPKHGCC